MICPHFRFNCSRCAQMRPKWSYRFLVSTITFTETTTPKCSAICVANNRIPTQLVSTNERNSALIMKWQFDLFAVEFSEKELCEAQDTILYHLSTCTEFKINEKEMVNQFRVSVRFSVPIESSKCIDWLQFAFSTGIGNDATLPSDAIFDQCIVDHVQYQSIFGFDTTGVIGSIAISAHSHTKQWAWARNVREIGLVSSHLRTKCRRNE